jgi:uncharacterized protein (TIGR02598 family)
MQRLGRTRFPRRVGGFSLVEVTIATGILTFSVVSVLGILPVGLTALRQSMDQTVETQILRSIGAQLVTADFASIGTWGSFYFDEEGQAMDSASEAYYVARVSTAAPVFPESSRSTSLSNSLTTLRVELTAQPNPSAPRTPKVFSLCVANTGN